MKCYQLLPCENMPEISQGIYDFLLAQTDIVQRLKPGWHFVDSKKLLTSVPKLRDYFFAEKLKVRHSAVTIVLNDDSLPIHVDELPVIAKINIPVLNTKGWSNRWWHGDKVIDEYVDQDQPMVFYSQIPHSVVQTGPVILPRIVASVTFFNEPLEFLR